MPRPFVPLEVLGAPKTENIPTYSPLPIPDEGIGGGDKISLTVNSDWLNRVHDVLYYLDQPDIWDGDDAQIEDARAEVRKLRALMILGENPVIKAIRWNANEQLEYSEDGDSYTALNPRVMPNRHPNVESGVEASGRFYHKASGVSGEVFRIDNAPSSRYVSLNAGVFTIPRLQIRDEEGTNSIIETIAKTSSGIGVTMALAPYWVDSTHASRASGVNFWLYTAAIGARPLRMELSPTFPYEKIGFLGNAPISRQTLAGNADSSLYGIAQMLQNFGLATNSMTLVNAANYDQIMTDVTLADSTLNIWRQSATGPAIWRTIDLGELIDSRVGSWAFGWSFESSAEFLTDLELTNGSVEFADDWIVATESSLLGNTVGLVNLAYDAGQSMRIDSVLVGYDGEALPPDVERVEIGIGYFVDDVQVDAYVQDVPALTGAIVHDPLSTIVCDEIRVSLFYEFVDATQSSPETKLTSLTIYGTGTEPPTSESTPI